MVKKQLSLSIPDPADACKVTAWVVHTRPAARVRLDAFAKGIVARLQRKGWPVEYELLQTVSRRQTQKKPRYLKRLTRNWRAEYRLAQPREQPARMTSLHAGPSHCP